MMLYPTLATGVAKQRTGWDNAYAYQKHSKTKHAQPSYPSFEDHNRRQDSY
jgi:hypothetical protein